jgi:SAM-dependent methyltransferase
MASALTSAAPWYKAWFDTPDYRRLYGKRDEREAAGFVAKLLEHLEPRSNALMLDLGCGTGRHSLALAARGYDVTGLDLAETSIREAQSHAASNLRFLRHDMRDPYGRERFDYVFSFFTSFGYFDNETEHDLVVRNMAGALRGGGTLVIDYLNVGHASANLVPCEQKTVGGRRYRIQRWTDATHFFKRIDFAVPETQETATHVERVAKFTLRDFEVMLSRHGLAIEGTFGDYTLGEYDPDASPRLIMIARKRAAIAREAA